MKVQIPLRPSFLYFRNWNCQGYHLWARGSLLLPCKWNSKYKGEFSIVRASCKFNSLVFICFLLAFQRELVENRWSQNCLKGSVSITVIIIVVDTSTWIALDTSRELYLRNFLETYTKFVTAYLQQTFVLIKTSWRRLEDVFRLGLQKTSSRRLDQDEHIRLSHTSSEDVLVKTNIFVLAIRLQDVFKTFSRRLTKTSSRRLQDVLKTSSRHLQDVLQRHLQYVFKMSCKNVFKTSSRRFEDIFKTSWKDIKDVFKMYHQVKLFLLTSLRDVFNTFLRRTAKTVIYRRICLGHTSEKVYKIGKSDKNFSGFSLVAFSGCLQGRI